VCVCQAWRAALCCAALCCAALRCAVLCCAALCCAVVWRRGRPVVGCEQQRPLRAHTHTHTHTRLHFRHRRCCRAAAPRASRRTCRSACCTASPRARPRHSARAPTSSPRPPPPPPQQQQQRPPHRASSRAVVRPGGLRAVRQAAASATAWQVASRPRPSSSRGAAARRLLAAPARGRPRSTAATGCERAPGALVRWVGGSRLTAAMLSGARAGGQQRSGCSQGLGAPRGGGRVCAAPC
jgi:hypothetical protein